MAKAGLHGEPMGIPKVCCKSLSPTVKKTFSISCWMMASIASIEMTFQENKLPDHKLVLIHYCAFNHIYNKPTHLWTNIMNWEPEGTTGTGLCERKCGMGMSSEKGKYKHKYTIARESQKEMAGAGRKAFKKMVPLMLQREIWGAWARM